MSGIYLKGLEMPKDDEVLYLRITPSGKVSIASDLKCREIARALPVPDHGRLGDLDACYRRIKAECNPYGSPTIGYDDGLKVLGIISSTPPIIPADKEEGA